MRRLGNVALALLMTLILALPVSAAVYSDISGHWAEQYVLKMDAKGLIHGDGNGRFNPDQTISNQEAIVLAVGLAGLGSEDRGTSSNLDLPTVARGSGEWAAPYIGIALEQDIISYDEMRSILWDQPAQRQAIAAWICKALKIEPVSEDNTGILQSFKDGSMVSADRLPYVLPLLQDKIIVGYNGELRPLDGVLRAEAAVMFSKADAKYPGSGLTCDIQVQITGLNGSPVDYITVKSASQPETKLAVNAQTLIFDSGRRISSDNLAIGEWLAYFKDQDGKLLYAEVVPEPGSGGGGGTVTPTSPFGDYKVYKGSLNSVDYTDDTIELESGTVATIADSSWVTDDASKEFDVPDGIEIWYEGDKLDWNDLDKHLDEMIYVIYDESLDEVVSLHIQAGDEYLTKGTIGDLHSDSYYFKLEGGNYIIRYDGYSTIFKDGTIVNNKVIDEGMKVFILIDRDNSVDNIVVMQIM
ncbi:MAG: S-layer homology domain-containing protein [Syntrophomonadaceae bacterium]